jgi:2-dehydro-3-deoxygluconokinase
MSECLFLPENGKILCFGELLFRIAPDNAGNWLKENDLPVYLGGAELNVATALALWDVPTQFLTALPLNNLSEQIVTYLQNKGIDLSQVIYQGNKLGLYFLTRGNDIKNSSLIYDRSNSAFTELREGMIDWDTVLDGVSWLHFSAICPAITEALAAVCLEALEIAAKKNITISIDLNYRSLLWQYGKSPNLIMPKLVQYADLIMGNIWAINAMLNIPLATEVHQSGQKAIYLQEAQRISEQILKEYPKCKVIANTFRFGEQKDITYYTALYTDNRLYVSKEYTSKNIVDKVGSGDCYMAGLIYGFYKHWDTQKTLDFATAAAFTKLFVESDSTNKCVADIQNAIL